MLQRFLSSTTLQIPATVFSCSGVTSARLAGTTNAVAVRAMQRMRKVSFIGVFIFFFSLLFLLGRGLERIR